LRRTTVSAAGLLLAACAGGPGGVRTGAPVVTGFLFESLRSGGTEYRYALWIPPAYDPSREWPLILFLHGQAESGTDGKSMAAVGLGPAVRAHPEEWPFVIVFPQKPTLASEWEEHEKGVMKILAGVRRRYRVDPSRLYLTGLSRGGHGTWVLGARHPELWAAIAPVCGYGPSPFLNRLAFRGSAAELAASLSKMPVWAFHGEADSVLPAERTREMVAALRRAGGGPKVTLFPGVGHNAWDRAYREEGLAAWLLGHRK
jgi:predicted peptidase